LDALARFIPFGRAILGLNLKEAQQVLGALDLGEEPETPAGLRAAAVRIRDRLGLALVVIHRAAGGGCATAEGAWWRPGRPTATPRITTGAGDHFNAGFVAGQLLGLDAEASLTLGLETGAYFVRTAASPDRAGLAAFIRESVPTPGAAS
jgi:sugar/nucleoside kinase (ribokinase family)